MESKLTRRQFAPALAMLPALPAQAQNPDEELKAARDQSRQLGDKLANVPLPMATEPAFQFKA